MPYDMNMSACMYMSRGMGVRGLACPAMLDSMIDVDLVLAREHQTSIHRPWVAWARGVRGVRGVRGAGDAGRSRPKHHDPLLWRLFGV